MRIKYARPLDNPVRGGGPGGPYGGTGRGSGRGSRGGEPPYMGGRGGGYGGGYGGRGGWVGAGAAGWALHAVGTGEGVQVQLPGAAWLGLGGGPA